MAQYIDKAAVVAEIAKRIKGAESVVKDCPSSAIFGLMQAYKNVLSFIDTLEVKGVDLEKEINKYISDNFFGSQTMGFFANRTKEEPNDQDIALCAKHFFQLGLQASKPLTWEDIANINDIVSEILKECKDKILYDTQESFCKEVLKRFKALKV